MNAPRETLPPEIAEIIDEPVAAPRRGALLRNYFLTGLIVAGPVAITVWITLWLIGLIDGWVKPLIPTAYNPETYLPFALPGIGVIVAFLGLTMLGFLTANLVGRTIVSTGEAMLGRTPIIRSVYKGVKQVFETVFSQEGSTFRKVGMIEWPGPGLWSICFIAAPAVGSVGAKLPDGEHVCVFLPCTPNPTTGYMLFVKRSAFVEIDLSVEDAFKMLMSMGIIQPAERPMAIADLPPLPPLPPGAVGEPASLHPADIRRAAS
jgi:uncharacterized membrane protein